MSNHYHLLVETREPTLSKGMRQLNGVYTQRFNRRHHRVGHVFRGRYKAILVDKNSYLLELARYIVLNPVRAAMVRSAREWPWSSYRATAGFGDVPSWLSVDWLLSSFDRRRGTAREAYRQFVSEGRDQPSPWHQLRQQVYLGDEIFVESIQDKLKADASLDEVPAVQRRPPPPPLPRYQHNHAYRDEAIMAAYASGEGHRRAFRTALFDDQPDHSGRAQFKIQDLTLSLLRAVPALESPQPAGGFCFLGHALRRHVGRMIRGGLRIPGVAWSRNVHATRCMLEGAGWW